MYQDYLNAVVDYYRTGERNASLPQRLMRPTPGNIKDECLSVCEVRFDKKDLRTLNAFFKVENDQHAMLRAIRRCERDRFRPLVNFLKGTANKTDYLNIELLAWLIDFPNRPFKAENYSEILPETSVNTEKNVAPEMMGVEKDSEESFTINKVEAGAETTEMELAKAQKAKRGIVKRFPFANNRRKLAAVVVSVFLLVLLGFYFVNKGTSNNIREKGTLKPIDGTEDFSVLNTSLTSPIRNPGITYARCVGSSPCKACSNCSTCNWCNSGGICGICAATKKTSTQKRAAQCQAITRKGKQCSRAAKAGSKYCWQHRL